MRQNSGMRVKVHLPEDISMSDAEFLSETYGGDFRKESNRHNYDIWVFSRVTEDSWKDFERDIARLRGTVVSVLRGNPLGEVLVVAGANPGRKNLREEYANELAEEGERILEEIDNRVSEVALELKTFYKNRDCYRDLKKFIKERY